MSEPTGTLAAALAKAQGQIKGATKDVTNPHFKSKYADLASVWEACRKPLSDNGLSVVQFTQILGEDNHTVLITKLLHASGESIEGMTPLLMGKQDMQALGSALTYARRYGLAAIVGVAPEDDDGNAAVGRPEPTRTVAVAVPAKPVKYDEWRTDLNSAADNGTEALRSAWTAAKQEYRDYFTATERTTDALKARAAKAQTVSA
jgi:hypothetical protein